MLRTIPALASGALLVLACAAAAQAPGPYYARGDFYCSPALEGTTPPDSCWGFGPSLELFDDGAHGDDAAGDGVYGAWVAVNQGPGMLQFKIANAPWTFAEPSVPAEPFVNGRLFTTAPGEVVHFRLDLGDPPYGWLPAIAVANDHAYPAGATLELMGSAPELGAWGTGLAAEKVGTIWQKKVTIATPGTYEYKFRVLGTWAIANFGYHYNNNYGANGAFATHAANTEMIFQFDERTGRIRAIDDANVPARTSTWGRLKEIYR